MNHFSPVAIRGPDKFRPAGAAAEQAGRRLLEEIEPIRTTRVANDNIYYEGQSWSSIWNVARFNRRVSTQNGCAVLCHVGEGKPFRQPTYHRQRPARSANIVGT
jgi:hypothetical protein